MQDMIFVSLENWDEIWRRNQFFVAEFARRMPERKILFVGLSTDVTYEIRHGRLGALSKALLPRQSLASPPEFPNVFLLNPTKWLPNSLGFGRAFNEWVARRQIAAAARHLRLNNPVLWLNPHYAVHLIGHLKESATLYDITDDWIEAAPTAAARQLIAAQDAQLCRRADAVIVCSEKLQESKRSLTAHLTLIPNGVDADHYRRVLDGDGPLPEIARAWTHPVIGYAGTLHSERIDVPLLAEVARRLPAATFVLIGPNQLRPEDSAKLQALPNIAIVGPVPYQRLPDYMRAFDVCMTPHRMTPFTESLNPIKLWEYLAAGKPIVSTEVAGFRDYPALVRCVRDAASFVEAIEGALGEDPAQREARRQEARHHSWASRVTAVLDVIDGCLREPASLPVQAAERVS